MRFKRILVPTDFSANAMPAAEVAVALAPTAGGAIELVHVYGPPGIILPDGSAFPATADELWGVTERAETALAQARAAVVARAAGIEVTAQALMGAPADEILRLAESGHYDLIVMGTHGRTGLRRLLMGSIAEAVMRRSPIPVLTIRAAAVQEARAVTPVVTEHAS